MHWLSAYSVKEVPEVVGVVVDASVEVIVLITVKHTHKHTHTLVTEMRDSASVP